MNLHNAFLGKTTMDGNRDTQKTDSFYLWYFKYKVFLGGRCLHFFVYFSKAIFHCYICIFPWQEETNLFWLHNRNINHCPMWVNYVAKGIVLKYLSNVCSYQVPLPPLLLSWISWIDLTDKMGNIFVRMSSVCQNPYFSPFHHVLVQCLESIMIFGYILNMTFAVYKSN